MVWKLGGRGPISLTLAGEPIRKYVVSRSSRPRVRTTLRMYVPTPNSVIRRMSMAIFTEGNLTTEDQRLHSRIARTPTRRAPRLALWPCARRTEGRLRRDSALPFGFLPAARRRCAAAALPQSTAQLAASPLLSYH